MQKEVPWIGPLHIYYTSPSGTLSYIPQQFFTYSITQILVQMTINGIKYFGLAQTGWAEQNRTGIYQQALLVRRLLCMALAQEDCLFRISFQTQNYGLEGDR